MNKLIALTINGTTIPITPGGQGANQADFQSLGDVVSRALQYILPLAGLILFAMIVISGFQLLTSAGEPKKMDSAKQRLIWGIIGFIVIFLSFWLMKLMEFLLGIKIL